VKFFEVGRIVNDHHRSLTSERRSHRQVRAILYAPGVASTTLLLILHLLAPTWVDLSGSSIPGQLTGALALFAGVLFSVSITLLDKAIDLDTSPLRPVAATHRSALRIRAMAANSLFASLLSGGAVALLVSGAVIEPVGWVFNAVAIGALVVLGINGLLIVGRVYKETVQRTDRARSGQSFDENRDDAA
jgi:hypothetical protein